MSLSFFQIRAELVNQMPYLARAIMACQPVHTDRELHGNVVLDQYWRVYYNPDELTDLEHHVRQFAAGICKLLQDHPNRLRDQVVAANCMEASAAAHVASEVCAAALLREVFPSGTTFFRLNDLPSRLLALLQSRLHPSVEDLFDTLLPPTAKPRPTSWDRQDQQDQSRQPSRLSASHCPEDCEAAQISLSGGPQRSAYRPEAERFQNASSAADGLSRVWEVPPPTQQQQMDIEQLKRQVAGDIKQSAGAHGIGDEPGNPLVLWAEQQLGRHPHAQIRSLYSVLQQASIYKHGDSERRFNGRNRRQFSISEYNRMGFVLPSSEATANAILFVLDTSGSMMPDSLHSAVTWIATVLEDMELDKTSSMYLGDTESKVLFPQITRQLVRSTKIPCGSGGTNMPHACLSAYKHHIQQPGASRPSMVICVTDGETHWQFDEELPVPLVIAYVCSGHTSAYSQATWSGDIDTLSPDDYMSALLLSCPPPASATVCTVGKLIE